MISAGPSSPATFCVTSRTAVDICDRTTPELAQSRTTAVMHRKLRRADWEWDMASPPTGIVSDACQGIPTPSYLKSPLLAVVALTFDSPVDMDCPAEMRVRMNDPTSRRFEQDRF